MAEAITPDSSDNQAVMPASDAATRHSRELPRNSPVSTLLLMFACALYLASLVLPAVEIYNVSTGKPTGTFSVGWEIVLTLLIPFLWVSGVTLLYLLVNVCFWISPFMLPLRRFQGAACFVYPMLLGIATVAAWASYPLVAAVSYGFFAWALSLTVGTVAFCIPLRRRSG